MSGVAGSRESWRVWWGRLTPWTLTPEGQAKQGLCSEALTPSGLVPPPEMGPSRSPSPTLQTPLSRPLKGTSKANRNRKQEINLQLNGCTPRDGTRWTLSGLGNNFLLLFLRSQVLFNA